jgi:hypothetical protein
MRANPLMRVIATLAPPGLWRAALSALLTATLVIVAPAAWAQASGPPSVGAPGGAGPGSEGGDFGGTESTRRSEEIEDRLITLPRDVRALPRAPTLPDLTHERLEMSVEHTIATVTPKPGGAPGAEGEGRRSSHLFDFDLELPIWRRIYLGGTWGFAAAKIPERERAFFVAGQPLLYARGAHTVASDRYAVGAGIGILPPVFTYGDADGSQAAAANLASIVRPWDLSSFLDRRATARPWIDLRASSRLFLLQVRQALDFNMRTSDERCTEGTLCERAGDIQVVSTSTVYLGWKPSREIALGLEAWQIYLLKTGRPIEDRDRSALALSPSVRFFYRWVEPAVSVLVPIGPPLLGAADSYFALRFDLRVWFGGR